MKNINQILVALDLSSFDQVLLDYTSFLSTIIQPKRIVFAHNVKKYELSELFQDQLEEFDLAGLIENKIRKQIKGLFKGIDTQIVVTEEYYTAVAFQNIVKEQKLDLAIVGNKNMKDGSGVVSSKLLYTLNCDILSVPEQAEKDIDAVLTTTDLSKASIKGMRMAESFAKTVGLDQVNCLHVFKIPQAFFPYLDIEKATAKAKTHSLKKVKEFVTKNNIELINSIVKSAGENNITDSVRHSAVQSGSDLVFISSKGKNSFNALLAGSVTESLFTNHLEIPLWVVR